MLDGCESCVRLCDPCARVSPCELVPCVRWYWGFFLYKKRLFSIQDIIIYHHISWLYHCVSCVSSSCISYIMSLVDTWYIACIIVFPSSCYIMWSHVAFLMIHGHDTDTWYNDDIWWYNAKIGLRTPRPPPYMISHDITWYHVPRPQPKPPEHKLWYHDISCSIMNHDTTWYIVIHVMIHEYKNTAMSPRYRMIYDDIRWYGDDLVAPWQLTSSLSPACDWQGGHQTGAAPQAPHGCQPQDPWAPPQSGPQIP
jgi:hypothetical protein